MSNCSKCIHYDVCKTWVDHSNSIVDIISSDAMHISIDDTTTCSSFKDKSLYKELPCNIGDTIYLTPRYNGKPTGAIVVDKVQMIGITSRGVHIKARDHQNFNKMYMLGNGAYLSSEAAQEALKKESEAK